MLQLMASSSMIRVAGLGVTLLTSIVLARLLGPAGFGYYSFALAAVTIIGLPVHGGLANLTLRETAKAHSGQHWSLLRGLWNWTGGIAIFLSLGLMVIFATLAWLSAARVVPVGGMSTLLVSFLLLPLIALAQKHGAAIRGLHRPVIGLLPDSIVRPFFLIGLLALVWVNNGSISPRSAMQLHVLAAIMAAIIAYLILNRVTPAQVKHAIPHYDARPAWRKALLPLALLAGTQIFLQNTNLLLLGYWEGAKEVGFFRIAISASNLVILGITAINLVMAPRFVQLHSVTDKANLERRASQATLLGFLTAVVATAILSVFGEIILKLLFGQEFVAAYTPMLILIIGQICIAWFGSCPTLLNMSGHEFTSLKIMVAALLMNIIASVFLIPAFGLMGAAIATSIIAIGWSIAFGVATRYKLGISATPLGLLSPMAKNPTADDVKQAGQTP